MNFKLEKAIRIIIEKNIAIKKSESLLILYDIKKEKLAKKFEKVSKSIIDKVDTLKITGLKSHGQEPTEKCAKQILKYDTVFFITSKSLSHTKARRDATLKGIRIASMPEITEEVLMRSIDIDYNRLKKDSSSVAKLLDKADQVRIKTKLGTDITFSIKGRKAHGLSAGIFNKKGKWGNLPEGEVFIAPIEGTATGHFIVDGSVAGFGKMDHPMIFIVRKGFVQSITNGKKPPAIEKLLDSIGIKARNIAEFGIGLNRKAKITGIVLEDEKAYGTCHIAIGNNVGFGGVVNVPLHIDSVILQPTIILDSKTIMKKGKLNPNIYK